MQRLGLPGDSITLHPWLDPRPPCRLPLSLAADMQRLGLPVDNITYTSDYFEQLKECGERLIKAGA